MSSDCHVQETKLLRSLKFLCDHKSFPQSSYCFTIHCNLCLSYFLQFPQDTCGVSWFYIVQGEKKSGYINLENIFPLISFISDVCMNSEGSIFVKTVSCQSLNWNLKTQCMNVWVEQYCRVVLRGSPSLGYLTMRTRAQPHASADFSKDYLYFRMTFLMQFHNSGFYSTLFHCSKQILTWVNRKYI